MNALVVITDDPVKPRLRQRWHAQVTHFSRSARVSSLAVYGFEKEMHPPEKLLRWVCYVAVPDLGVRCSIHEHTLVYQTVNLWEARGYNRSDLLISGFDLLIPLLMAHKYVQRGDLKVDAAFCHGVWAGMTGVLLKAMGRTEKLIYEDVDYAPGYTTSRFRGRILKWMEQGCVRSADWVVSTNNDLALLRRSQGARQVVVIPNGVDYNLFAAAQVKEPHSPTLVYLGAFQSWSGLDLVIRAFPDIVKRIPSARLLLIGGGAEEDTYKRLAQDAGCQDRIIFYGYLPYEDIPAVMREGDIGIAMHVPNERIKYSCSMKILQYMASGMPVVTTNISERAALVRESGAGLAIPFNSECFVGAVTNLLLDQARYITCAQNAIACAQRYDWARIYHDELTVVTTR